MQIDGHDFRMVVNTNAYQCDYCSLTVAYRAASPGTFAPCPGPAPIVPTLQPMAAKVARTKALMQRRADIAQFVDVSDLSAEMREALRVVYGPTQYDPRAEILGRAPKCDCGGRACGAADHAAGHSAWCCVAPGKGSI